MYHHTIVVGNTGNDPNKSTTPAGATVTNFTVAANEIIIDKQGRKTQKITWCK